MEKYSILVNSTDSFSDCWEAFFKLFKIYWPEYSGKIYLNSESKGFDTNNLNIINIRNNSINFKKNISWSECLIRALDFINDEIILYLQEDYFLCANVDGKFISVVAELMMRENLKVIYLSEAAGAGPFHPTDFNHILKLDQKADYKINCQPALWNKKTLQKYLRRNETAWLFEYYGTKRLHYLKDEFYIINFKELKKNILPYIITGIMRGKWNNKVIELFNSHDIKVDFTKRGFYEKAEKNNIFNKVFRYTELKLLFTRLLSIIEIVLLRIKFVLDIN